jgi:hypothetical protein
MTTHDYESARDALARMRTAFETAIQAAEDLIDALDGVEVENDAEPAEPEPAPDVKWEVYREGNGSFSTCYTTEGPGLTLPQALANLAEQICHGVFSAVPYDDARTLKLRARCSRNGEVAERVIISAAFVRRRGKIEFVGGESA